MHILALLNRRVPIKNNEKERRKGYIYIYIYIYIVRFCCVLFVTSAPSTKIIQANRPAVQKQSYLKKRQPMILKQLYVHVIILK